MIWLHRLRFPQKPEACRRTRASGREACTYPPHTGLDASEGIVLYLRTLHLLSYLGDDAERMVASGGICAARTHLRGATQPLPPTFPCMSRPPCQACFETPWSGNASASIACGVLATLAMAGGVWYFPTVLRSGLRVPLPSWLWCRGTFTGERFPRFEPCWVSPRLSSMPCGPYTFFYPISLSSTPPHTSHPINHPHSPRTVCPMLSAWELRALLPDDTITHGLLGSWMGSDFTF